MNNFFKDSKKLICPLSKSKKFKLLFKIKRFPIYMGTVKKNTKYEYKTMNFLINKSSGSVQIYPRVNLKKLYFKSHGSGKIGNVWKKHHNKFLNFLKIRPKMKILEIGGGHNPISNKLFLNKKKISLTSFEPNGKKQTGSNFKIIKEFFLQDSFLKYKLENKYNLAIHSHLFEHIYEPDKFLILINKSLKKNGLHIFAVPNMLPMIKKGIASAMNFEHPFFLSEKLIKELLLKTGFKIIEKKYYGRNHSIFFKTKKINDIKDYDIKNSYKTNSKIFLKLRDCWKKDIKLLNKKIAGKKDVFLFGAHIFSQMLIFNGLKNKNISGILDNDKHKQGNYLYGTNFSVFDPKILKNKKKPIIILRAGEYNNEIKKKILNQINKHTLFI